MADVQIVNPYTDVGLFRRMMRRTTDSPLTHRMRALLGDVFMAWYDHANPGVPSTIEIETINRCNNTCSFCPVNARVDPREQELMSWELVEKIADDLEKLDYGGRLALFSNNEPLLDDRLEAICALFRKKAPKAHLFMYTNGTIFRTERYLGLFDAGLDEMIIDNYHDDFVLIPRVKKLLKEVNPSTDPRIEAYKSKTQVVLRRKTEVLTNRGGTAPNKQEDTTYRFYRKSGCVLPFIQLIIRPSGEISLCCQDALGKMTLGDLKTQTISEVWNGEAMRNVRTKLKTRGRDALPLCQGCDVAIVETSVLKRRAKQALRKLVA